MEEQNLEPEQERHKILIIGVSIFALLTLIVVAYWFVQKSINSKNDLVSLVKKDQQTNKSLEWETYVSDDGHFKIDYPKDWEILSDEGLYFGRSLYDENRNLEATIEIEKIGVTNKKELQEALRKKQEICLEENDDCPPTIEIDEMTRLKISGELARINTDNKYLSGTTIYAYLNDYYLAIYLEYNDEVYLPIFEKMVDSIFIDIESKYKHYYCNRKPGDVPMFTDKARFTAYCHKVEVGDTLWSIAETYYGDPHLWGQLKVYNNEKNYDLSRVSPDDPKALSSGTELVLWNSLQFSNDNRTSGGIVEGFGLDIDTGDLFTTNNEHVYINNDIYDKDFSYLKTFFIDERTNNKIYIVIPKKEEGESMNNEPKHQFIFNKQRNPYIGAGQNFELLTFNHDEDKYAVRTNVKQDVTDPSFIALSNIGNGPEYEYLDSIIWYDNDTLIYRAQNNDEWRLVINHEDHKTYDYIENLRAEDGIIKFDSRNKQGVWSKEEISIAKNQYNARLVSIPDVPPVGDEFITYLKDTRSDLSEAELFKIEKNYHYKTGTLIDEFGNLVEDPVELYLEPISGMGLSEDIGKLVFTAEKGKFELFVYDIGPYTLSLQDGWSADDLTGANPVDFRYSGSDYRIKVSNDVHDRKAREKYTYKAEIGDTLWSFAKRYYGQGYYWPLIVENNNLDFNKANSELNEGYKLYMPPLMHFSSIEELDGLRKKFHEENVEEMFTINNEEFSYSVDYPECWELGKAITKEYNENAPYYDTDIHEQWIMGPEYPNLPGKGRAPWFIIRVYDNRDNMNVEEFAVKIHITDRMLIDNRQFTTERQEDGSVLINSGYYNDLKHLLFFKDGLIYDVSYVSHPTVDATSKQEMLGIVSSFKFLD